MAVLQISIQLENVPGALTNQPPVPATAPVTTPPVAGTAGAEFHKAICQDVWVDAAPFEGTTLNYARGLRLKLLQPGG